MAQEPARRVLLTGAAGTIGSAFFHEMHGRYRFRLADRAPLGTETFPGGGHEAMTLDVVDLAACQRACAGMDTVIHLAANASPDGDFSESLLDNNIKGVFNIFRAAKDQGCTRVIFASSAWVFGGYPQDVQLTPESPVRPINMYGVSKCFGENVAACFAQAEGLSSIVVRIGAYDNGQPDNWLRGRATLFDLTTYVSGRDLHHLLVQCVEAPGIQLAIVHGISDNRFKRLDLTSTRALLGYAPQDDGFSVLAARLPDAFHS